MIGYGFCRAHNRLRYGDICRRGWTTSSAYRYITVNITIGPVFMEVEYQSLAACDVAPDGTTIVLGFLASDGKSTRIRLSLNEAGTLAMTLPSLLDRALWSRYGDRTLRYVHPLVSWRLEQSSDPTTVMITLGSMDGFSVCFSMGHEQQTKLGEALTAEHAGDTAVVAH